jgi:hypothetical protein
MNKKLIKRHLYIVIREILEENGIESTKLEKITEAIFEEVRPMIDER